MFWGSKMAVNALHCISDLLQSTATSSPLVTELPVEVVLFCCHTPPLNTALSKTVQSHD